MLDSYVCFVDNCVNTFKLKSIMPWTISHDLIIYLFFLIDPFNCTVFNETLTHMWQIDASGLHFKVTNVTLSRIFAGRNVLLVPSHLSKLLT